MLKFKILIILLLVPILFGCGNNHQNIWYLTFSPHSGITEVSETWRFHSLGLQPEAENVLFNLVAPEVIQMDGGYRLFAARVMIGQKGEKKFEIDSLGVGTFFSNDGEEWEYESMILENENPDVADYYSHCYVLELNEGYRIFCQRDDPAKNIECSEKAYSIWSAYSENGITWEEEGMVISLNEMIDLVAHGRAMKLDKDNYILVFSGNKECQPGSVFIARSTDGKNWDVDKEELAIYSHDPTIIYENGILKIYYKYLMENFFYVESYDLGKTFSEPKLVEFLDENGDKTLPEDIDFDGVKYMWTNTYSDWSIPEDNWQFAKFVKES
ncbi:MAG: sialidase family protein [archaeon]